jgi:hypothetical protein
VQQAATQHEIQRVSDLGEASISSFLARYDLTVEWLPSQARITASFWGDPEAGIAGQRVYVRDDTPVHSMLHEVCHIICMNSTRREHLDRDAGGDDLEESAVCYLQIVLADFLPAVGADRLMADMDCWGYSFRLGSTGRWFYDDADDARCWLIEKNLLTKTGQPVFRLRDD